MNDAPTFASTDTDREIIISRLFDAPRELVWKVWTQPEHVAKWWGPNGFTNTIHEMDVRPGGIWSFIMHGPDGTDYYNKIVFTEVVEPERLSYTHGGDEGEDEFLAVVTFTEKDGKTEVTMRSIFESAEVREKMIREVGAIEGGKQTLGRLGDYLATQM